MKMFEAQSVELYYNCAQTKEFLKPEILALSQLCDIKSPIPAKFQFQWGH